MKEFTYKGFTIFIGVNEHDNQTLVLNSDPDDYWTHISGFPSATFHQNNPFYVFVIYDVFSYVS